MKLLILSDVHTEFRVPEIIVPVETDVIILAGDIGVYGEESLKDFLHKMNEYNKPVLYVLGNHEFYGTSNIDYLHVMEWFRNLEKEFCNLIILHNETVIVEGVNFVGTPLWTNFDDDFWMEKVSQKSISDFVESCFTTKDYIQMYEESEMFIASNIVPEMINVVITHFPPLEELTNPKFPKYNSYFNNRMGWVCNLDVDLWVYGHNHWSLDKEINGVHFASNQLGYPRESTNFKSGYLVKI